MINILYIDITHQSRYHKKEGFKLIEGFSCTILHDMVSKHGFLGTYRASHCVSEEESRNKHISLIYKKTCMYLWMSWFNLQVDTMCYNKDHRLHTKINASRKGICCPHKSRTTLLSNWKNWKQCNVIPTKERIEQKEIWLR
jgi:hypothetical protein